MQFIRIEWHGTGQWNVIRSSSISEVTLLICLQNQKETYNSMSSPSGIAFGEFLARSELEQLRHLQLSFKWVSFGTAGGVESSQNHGPKGGHILHVLISNWNIFMGKFPNGTQFDISIVTLRIHILS